MADRTDFRGLEAALAPELLNALCTEHDREVQALYHEELELRTELSRIVTLMRTEILPREKQMHDLIHKMSEMQVEATRDMDGRIREHLGKQGLTDAHHLQRVALRSPMEEMERELQRIATLLSHDLVRPDIPGWGGQDQRQGQMRSPQPSSRQSPSRQPAAQVSAPSSLFDKVDVNHDGYISRREFNQALNQQGRSPASPSKFGVIDNRARSPGRPVGKMF